MLPRLVAEEQSASATQSAVGQGTKPGPWIRKQWSLWNRAKRGSAPAVKATVTDIRSLGIGYVAARPKENG